MYLGVKSNAEAVVILGTGLCFPDTAHKKEVLDCKLLSSVLELY